MIILNRKSFNNKRNCLSVNSLFLECIEIKQISFVYQQNRFTVVVVLMMTDLILAFAKAGLLYISNIYIK